MLNLIGVVLYNLPIAMDFFPYLCDCTVHFVFLYLTVHIDEAFQCLPV